ncbi:MAG: ABC transporter ATP-binding protein [Bdellovibrionota bacterium]
MDPLNTQLAFARGRLVGASLLLLLQSAILVALPWPLKLVFDTLSTGAPSWLGLWLSQHTPPGMTPFSWELSVASLSFLVLAAIAAVLTWREHAVTSGVALGIVNGLRRDLLGQLLHGRLQYVKAHRPEDLAERLSEDTLSIEAVLISGLRSVARAAPSLALLVGILLALDTRLAFILLVSLVPFYFLASSLGRRMRIHRKRSQQEAEHFQDEIQRTMRFLPGVKSMAIEEAALEALDSRSLSAIGHEGDSRRAIGVLLSSILSMKSAMRAAVTVVGGFAVANGEITLGTLALVFAYVESIDGSILELGRFMSQWRNAQPALHRIRTLSTELDAEEEIEGAKGTSSLPFPDADILKLDKVVLEAGAKPITAEFEPGELIALVGVSGTGKSYFGQALNRLIDPISGSITIGRTDIKRYRLKLLRTTVTVVDRQPFFIRGSIRENLRLAAPQEADIDDQYLSEALHAAVVDFIGDLPEKLETVIGEGAYPLTTDQTARLHVARAFLRYESRVFFFDDPTADLEPEEARSVFESIRLLTERGAIVFWVTRRLDEAAESDRVIYFQNAKDSAPRIETHDQLMASDEAYRRIFGLRERLVRPGLPTSLEPAAPPQFEPRA